MIQMRHTVYSSLFSKSQFGLHLMWKQRNYQYIYFMVFVLAYFYLKRYKIHHTIW